MTQMPEMLATIPEAMEFLKVSRSKIDTMLASGELTRVKLKEGRSGAVRIPLEELRALAESTVETDASPSDTGIDEEDDR